MSPYRQHPANFQLQHDLTNNRGLSMTQQLPPVLEGYSRLYLCRHGQTDFNCQRKLQGRGVNMQLNANGLDQAKYLAKAMKDVPLSGIYSSSLTRAFQTADAVAKFHPEIQVESFSEVEEMNFGELEGHSMKIHDDQIRSMFKRWEKGEFNASWPGGESPMDVVNRGVKKITEVMSTTLPKEQVLMIHQDNTCVNVIDFDHATQTYCAMALNNINHLPSPPSV
ncbi:unnamed protein product [Peronospora farinosa]|uniref:Phosphoglycerate mutase n=1 Tax=Peronospora farinosa TaxID=134698 RepID=A0ABN8BV09_9STRA|nr:unnamed protein product [Peronospora farinosa]